MKKLSSSIESYASTPSRTARDLETVIHQIAEDYLELNSRNPCPEQADLLDRVRNWAKEAKLR